MILAEKNRSYGTQKILRNMFNVQFNQSTDIYSCRLQSTTEVVVHYINLCRVKEDNYYAENIKTMIKEKNIAKIICFEYCNPRLDSFPSNIEILSRLVASYIELYEKIYFVFSFEDQKTTERELFSFLKNFDITNRIPNFPDKVSLLVNNNEEKIIKKIISTVQKERPSTATTSNAIESIEDSKNSRFNNNNEVKNKNLNKKGNIDNKKRKNQPNNQEIVRDQSPKRQNCKFCECVLI